MLLCLQESLPELLRKKHLLSLAAVCCLFVVFAGCRDKNDGEENPEGATKVEIQQANETPGEALARISPDPFKTEPPALPTDAELNALGPIREENREFLRFMPDNASSYIAIQPSRMIRIPCLTQYSDVAEISIGGLFASGFIPYFPGDSQIPFANIKRMSMCTKPIKQQPSINAMGEYSMSQPDQIPTCVCVLELNEPVEDILLLSIFNRSGIAVESLQPTMVGNMKAYDLLAPTEVMPAMERLVFVNDRTVVFAAGSVAEVAFVLDNEPGKGALASRVLRTDTQNCDLLALYSTEGVTFGFMDMIGVYLLGKRAFGQFQGQPQQFTLQMQEEAMNFATKPKSISIRLDLQAPESGNILQADFDLQKQENAAPMQKAMQSPITELVNAASFELAKSKETEVPAEHAQAFADNIKTVSFMISLLENLNATASGSKVQLAMKKSPGFDQSFQETLTPVFEQIRKARQTGLDVDAMRNLGRVIDLHLESNMGRFPNYAVMSAEGTPLLSWRVAVLPYIGEQDLYNQFRMNEPWDSEHNRTLIEKMPKWFADPSGQTPNGKTIFRLVGGEGSFLSKHPNGFSMSDLTFPEGTLYMIAVNSENAVEWTRPEFVPFDPATFGSTVKEFFAAMFCNRVTQLFPTDQALASGEMQYWLAGTMSPKTAAEVEAMQRYQQYQQMQQQQAQGGMGQPVPNQPMQGQPPVQGTAPQPQYAPPVQPGM